MLTPEDIYNRTRGGLDIILHYYPEAEELHKKKQKFKVRDEATASASIKEFNNVWKVTDFGDDGRALSGIDLIMREEKVNFYEALWKAAKWFNISKAPDKSINFPDIQVLAIHDLEEGHVEYELNKGFTPSELSILGVKGKDNILKEETCNKYKYYSVKWYHITKGGKTTKISSNDNYPIFLRECQYTDTDGKPASFQKIYQPLNPDKQFRFFYVGNKPKDYINGLTELIKAYNDFNTAQEKAFKAEFGEEAGYKIQKLDEAIICSGERDSLCAAAFGYNPIWFNSETHNFTEFEYKEISKYVNVIYNIPDIDSTGIKKGIELAMKFIDIRTVWLPSWLRGYDDLRRKPRKDLRDYLELRPTITDFKNLLRVAMPVKFWDTVYTKFGPRLEVNTEYVFHFLNCNGFGLIENKNEKNGFSFVKVENNVVKEVRTRDIKAFIRNFLKSRFFDTEILNLVNNTTRLTSSAFDSLEKLELNFIDFDSDRQFMYFQNTAWEVTAAKVTEIKLKDLIRAVWDDELIKHDVKRLPDSFAITTGEHGSDIEIKHQQSNYFKFLTNASRVHWRTEYEKRTIEQGKDASEYIKANRFNIAGPLLTDDEIKEQKSHLINKIFTLGYNLHRFKTKSRAWLTFAMDNKIGDDTESNGRSGKTFCISSLGIFMKTITESGRNEERYLNDKHVFDRVNEHTDLVIIDDLNRNVPIGTFFDRVTGNFIVNPKNNLSYEIPYEQSPKICVTSNFSVIERDPSTEGRLLYMVFSDYYHIQSESNDYKESYTIRDDFGKDLFGIDYTSDEWNADLNFFADCLKFYLSTLQSPNIVKIQPPMGNVSIRRQKSIMGENFEDWAHVYFSEEAGNLDTFIERAKVVKDYEEYTNNKKSTPQSFMKRLKTYCAYEGFMFNPKELCNAKGRIIKTSDGKARENFYIKAHKELDVWMVATPSSDENKPF